MSQVAFIGSASGWGAQVRDTEKGPDTVRTSGVLETLPFSWEWVKTIHPQKSSQDIQLPNGLPTVPYIEDVCRKMAQTVEKSLADNKFPIVIGGDHSIAIGTWMGMVKHYNAYEKFGLIWIDAHMDAHTPDTTPSQAYHGMPLAVLLGRGNSSLVNISTKSPIFCPEHVCLIGVRSFEHEEERLLKDLGVRIFDSEEVQRRGFHDVLKDALSIVKKGTLGYGVTIDLDAFDPSEAPGVGSPEAYGLKRDEVMPTFRMIQKDLEFKGLEIVEYNPMLDHENKTLHLLRDTLENLIPTGG